MIIKKVATTKISDLMWSMVQTVLEVSIRIVDLVFKLLSIS